MRQKLKASKELQQFMRDRKLGILDETTPGIMAKTGATGAHWHIGPDRQALLNLEKLIARKGIKLQNGGTIKYTPFNQDGGDEIHLVQDTPNPYKPKYDLSRNPFIDETDFNRWYSYIAGVKKLSPDPNDPEHYYD